jgi:hypothetical protein
LLNVNAALAGLIVSVVATVLGIDEVIALSLIGDGITLFVVVGDENDDTIDGGGNERGWLFVEDWEDPKLWLAPRDNVDVSSITTLFVVVV